MIMVEDLILGEGFGETSEAFAFFIFLVFLALLAGGDLVEDESSSEGDDPEGEDVGVGGLSIVRVGATVEVTIPVVTVMSPTKKVVGIFGDDAICS